MEDHVTGRGRRSFSRGRGRAPPRSVAIGAVLVLVLVPDAEERAVAIRMLLFDADGVMTDGRLQFAPNGEEWKTFDSKDGLGLRIARDSGLLTGVVTGRRSIVLERRAQELRFEEVHQGVLDKGRVLEAI